MINLTATEARKSFFELIKQSNQKHDIFEVRHKTGNAILMSLSEYESLQESLYLLSLPHFKEDLLKSEQEANNGDTFSFDDVFGEEQ
ncbi:antitoxin YefM [Bathymodiolus platifrons methanotrophic gill symbiont]|uniref:type II toxin-antitoxin system Phd/YefM family antitoxin n=1 Tax=Bathymodiolus platifrons methanotrophic gill symbiont TaxID=113268 RepID=UPI000B41B530|nr:type II toxin-antitoxin system Phd/YefM family antitoxin [Bathymodiolus platifrons methanotrophic gill symbiont]TXK94906.1 prevent-host-death protein [Methylococcaceae bacterium CS4]TXK99199.1 prevent-host-death protein [Methylococcaceae bacterium CS5]TXL01699.1 prevent-host-death protein [Methylococcaceae bacterium HT1]TXL04951.1 prevent-host-death protein [Methylococcaceae bacterium CS3]TXL08596.1 prevent-host-death protein [Methylococcaceae bacterium CS1]TXL12237.1 prevent-host-death pr